MTTVRNTDTRPQGWLKPLNNNGAILIRFQLSGKTYTLTPVKKGKFDNPKDLRQAMTVCEQIEWDIRRNLFDATLTKYKPTVDASETLKIEPKLTLGKLWDDYKKDKELVVQKTTQKVNWKMVDTVLEKCRLLQCEDFFLVKNTILSQYSVSTARTVLVPLTAALNHAIKQKVLVDNPLTQIVADLKQAEKNQQKENGTTAQKAFTKDERDRIIEAFKSNEFCPKYSRIKHSYYTAFVQFLFFTGCRPEDAIALTWGDIGKQIEFSKAHSKGINKSTKNGEIRKMPINAQLAEILDNHRATLSDTKPNSLVFPSIEGKNITIENFGSRIWRPIVKKLVELGEVSEYLPTYNCRHTFISLCLEANISPHTVAKWVETSVSMIEKHYGAKLSSIQVPEI